MGSDFGPEAALASGTREGVITCAEGISTGSDADWEALPAASAGLVLGSVLTLPRTTNT